MISFLIVLINSLILTVTDLIAQIPRTSRTFETESNPIVYIYATTCSFQQLCYCFINPRAPPR
jgi:hypothetical protein